MLGVDPEGVAASYGAPPGKTTNDVGEDRVVFRSISVVPELYDDVVHGEFRSSLK